MQTSFTAPGVSGPGAAGLIKTPGPGDDSRRNWTSIQQMAFALKGLTSGLQELRDQVNAMKERAAFLDTLHPFKIYQLPAVLRAAPNATTDWLKFRVRAGRVLGDDATGTDANDVNPDDETYPDVDDITVPSGVEEYWFWLDGTVVKHGYDDGAGGDPVSQGWTSFPDPDATHIPIGFVDTDTLSGSYTAIIRQLLRTDVVTVGGGGGTAKEFLVASSDNDHWLCCETGDTALAGTRTSVLKPFALRGSVTKRNLPEIALNTTDYTDDPLSGIQYVGYNDVPSWISSPHYYDKTVSQAATPKTFEDEVLCINPPVTIPATCTVVSATQNGSNVDVVAIGSASFYEFSVGQYVWFTGVAGLGACRVTAIASSTHDTVWTYTFSVAGTLTSSPTPLNIVSATQNGANVDVVVDGAGFTGLTAGRYLVFTGVAGLTTCRVVSVADSNHFSVVGTLTTSPTNTGTVKYQPGTVQDQLLTHIYAMQDGSGNWFDLNVDGRRWEQVSPVPNP